MGYLPYEVDGKQLLIFKLQGNVSGGCNTEARFAVDSSSPKFKGTQVAVITAFHTQADVTVTYATACGAWSNSWDAVLVCVGAMSC